MTIVVIAIVGCLAPSGFRLISEGIATVVGIVLVVRGRRVARDILAIRSAHARQLGFDRKPSRAQRRALAAGLRCTMRHTEWMSLFPSVMSRAQSIVDACGG